MLTCITCSKQRLEGDDGDAPRGFPNTKDGVKSLTSQIKDIALKVSGSHKSKENGGMKRAHGIPHPPYLHQQGTGGSSCSSTPAWDYHNNSKTRTGVSRFSAFSSNGIPGPNAVLLQHDDNEPREWTSQVEPGVQITFVSLPRGGNELKRIRFSREMFNKWQAQRWWGENYDRIMELYNVQRFNPQGVNTPGRSEDGRDSSYSRLESPRVTGATPARHSRFHQYQPPHPRAPEMDASRTTTSSRDEASVSISNASEIETEWIEEDEPGVFITIRQLVDGTRELRRVRFSRQRFGEVHAKLWWDTNRDRIQSQYLCQN